MFISRTTEGMARLIRRGLPPTSSPKNVVIVGAGMAGLVAGSLLKEAGHQVILLEASDRVGGRVHTLRSPFTDGLYFEAGAMRIPAVHVLIFEYIKKFGLQVNEFFNSTPNDILYINGIHTRQRHYEQHPDIFRFPMTPQERGKTAKELLQQAIRPFWNQYHQLPPPQRQALMREMDKYSFERYLRMNPFGVSLSPAAVDLIKIIWDVEGLAEHSFLKILEILSYFLDPQGRFYELTGGFDRLPRAFFPRLRENIRFGHKVEGIVQKPGRVHIQTRNPKSGESAAFEGDVAILTLPFTVLQHIDVQPRESFSFQKWKAIRELHYAPAVRTGIQFKRRFWEREGLRGGKMITDLPVRFAYYPSHGIGSSGPGVVLASYTWEDDSMPWSSLSEAERVPSALHGLSRIHGPKVYQEFVTGTSFAWTRNPLSSGAFSLLKPFQNTEIGPHIATPEGRVHFAGEHTSSKPAWVEGAIESGVRVAMEVHQRRG